ncbi:hypothetical protein HMPREF3034_01055 [Prevotella sp. DNF00663]|nr:hypothetical protein HMPREF3034_01055 [Prevotella sp. DNF00663]
MPQLIAYFGMVVIFQVVDKPTFGRMAGVVKEGNAAFDRYQSPKHLGHFVIVRLQFKTGSGQMEVTSTAHHLFVDTQPTTTHRTTTWCYDI